MKKLITLFLFSFLLNLGACQPVQEKADMVLHNTVIYTVEKDQAQAEAVAVKDGIIQFVGSNEEVQAYIGSETKVLDLEGLFVYPGLIEGHAHLMGIGHGKLNLDLSQVSSYAELVEKVKEAADQLSEGEWILGRGWHQSKWENSREDYINGFPRHHLLSEAVPNHPVFLVHASGHAAFANAKAMELAGITATSEFGSEGEILKDKAGKPTGVLNEKAQDLVKKIIPAQSLESERKALELALEECARYGITSFHDAGAGKATLDLYKQFIDDEKMTLRIYAMLDGKQEDLLQEYYQKGPEIGYGNNLLSIRSIKLYGDGALGSRGAWLLEDYSDRPGHRGHAVTDPSELKRVAKEGHEHGFQICIHAIGDRANQEILNIYQEVAELSEDHRFRIEHAQHLHPSDIERFAAMGVVPAMQAIHMSSDRPWAIRRLGKKRIEEGAYMWQSLLQSGAPVVNGTDAPVEPLNPFASFYASVTRKTLGGKPEEGYEPKEKMTREQALESYTIHPAFGAFEEELKGSIKVGKLADFSVLKQDIMQVPEKDLLKTEVAYTILGGTIIYQNE